jgi:transcriptional antiterminator RfaH
MKFLIDIIQETDNYRINNKQLFITLRSNRIGKVLNKASDNQWFALYTKSRAEKKVDDQLKKMGIKTYLPLKKELRQWSDRKKWVESPIISSYIFVNIVTADYKRVFEANGVVAYVSHKGKAVPIPNNEIDAMRRTVENKLSFSVETNSIKKGQMVTVTSGPLQGITGEVMEVQGEKKLHLRISHIGYMLVVNLDKDTIVE